METSNALLEPSSPRHTHHAVADNVPLRWENSLTLLERLQWWRHERPLSTAQDNVALHMPQHRLARWREQKPFDQPGLFEKKLAALGTTDVELGGLLNTSARCLVTHADSRPDWVAVFERAQREFAEAPLCYPLNPDAEVDFAPLMILVNPLVAWGVDQLQRNMAELAVHGDGQQRFDADALVLQWLGALRGQLVRMVSRVLTLELGVARIEKRLVGDNPQDRYHNFFAALRDPVRARSVWNDYPVLARQVTELIQTKVVVMCEFLTHLTADWNALEHTFSTTERLGPLVAVSLNQGDSHGGGKGVFLARFESDQTIVYKPRPMSVEANFQRLLQWLNARGAEPHFQTLTVLDRGDHGWVEFVQAHGCTSDDEVQRFYRRLGGYTALFYLLGANDFHSQNLIAAGEHPMPIDLETLFHATAVRSNSHPIDRLFHRANEDSVMKIGLLPRRMWSNDDSEGVDISGLGGGTQQMAPDPALCWAEPGTDQMYVTRDKFMMGRENNRPTLRDEDVSPAEFCDAISRGFTAMYRLLMQHRRELQSHDGPLSWFATDQVRVILRDTRTYAELLNESFHPDFMQNALERDQLFDRLWTRVVHQPHMQRTVAAEQADLWARDIPMFTSRPDARHLWTSRGECIEDIFEESGLDAARGRLARLSEDDLSCQLWLIESSLAALGNRPDRHVLPIDAGTSSLAPATDEDLLDAARQVADRLEQLAVRDGDLAIWFGSRYLHDRWSVELVGLDLYDGLPGIALFLAHMGKVCNEDRYTALAQAALATVEAYLRSDEYQPPGVGGFSGLGGLVYALSQLAALWERPDLLDLAESLLARWKEAKQSDSQFDIVSGAAGCICGLLSLHAVRPTQATLAAARRCGDVLVNAADWDGDRASWTVGEVAELPLAGFSHGASGMAHALLALFDACGDRRYLETAQAAFRFERTLFSLTDQNWIDRRDGHDHEHGAGRCMTAWCHGAPGIGLARLKALGLVDDPAIWGEIDAAVECTLRNGFGHNHSLCHGDLGNLELVFEASRILNDPQSQQQTAQLAADILRRIARDGYLCGVPLGQETTGLMNGLAGIGYGLLRLARPQRVPSVLTLEPPRL